MTYRQAFEILRDTPIDVRSTRGDMLTIYATAQLIALDCIEKQIPKKPTRSVVTAFCPRCDNVTRILGMRYCDQCGQALDWSE